MTVTVFTALRRATPRQRIALALLTSLLIHALIYGGWQLGRQLGWKGLPLPNWLKELSIAKLITPKPPDPEKLKLLPPPPPPEREVQLTFVDVDPALAITEPPKTAKFYSTANTKAANPSPKADLNQPQINGKQTQVVKTVEATKPVPQADPKPPAPKAELPEPKPEPTPPTPAPAPAPAPKPPPEIAKSEPKPKSPDLKGDLAMLKPAPEAKSVPEMRPAPVKVETVPRAPSELQPAAPGRPRTIREALSRTENSAIAGERMKQDGGVRNIGHVALDVRSSLTGAYDAALIAAVQKRWYDLLADRNTPRGQAVVVFRLHYDGRVTDAKLAECDVGELLGLICQKAIVDPAPYPRWPSDMRRQLDADYRDVKFTFYYN